MFTVRIGETADDSLAAIFECNKFGIAGAARIRMIATTINSSISEKPFRCFFIYSPQFPVSLKISEGQESLSLAIS